MTKREEKAVKSVPKKSGKKAVVKKAVLPKKKTSVRKKKPVASELPSPIVSTVEELAVFEQPAVKKVSFFFSPQGDLLLKKTTTLLNRVILVSSVSVYIIAFVLAGLTTFADVGTITPDGPLAGELINAGKVIVGNEGRTADLGVIVARFLQFFFGALGLLFSAFIFYAGFSWITAAGDEKKVGNARGIIFHSLLGLIVCLASFSLASAWLDGLAKAVFPGKL